MSVLETRAIVVSVDGEEAVVIAKYVGCGQCDNEKGCASGKLSQLFCSKPRQFRVRNQLNARVGEEVNVMVADGVLLRSSIILYLIPVMFLLLGGLLGSSGIFDSVGHDGYAVTGALLGLVTGFVFANQLISRQQVQAEASPVIARL